jgi:hypothetical protein
VGTPGIGPGYQGSGDGAEFPAEDTVVTQPIASTSRWNVWFHAGLLGNAAATSVALIVPGLDAFSGEPALPTINEPLPSGLSQAGAQKLVTDLWKTFALQVWAMKNSDTGLLNAVDPAWVNQFGNGDPEVLSEGGDVSEPNCDWYPSAVTIVATSSVSAWVASGVGAAPSPDPWSVVLEYRGATQCVVTDTVSGSTSTVSAAGPSVNFLEEVDDTSGAPLGDYARVDSGANCGAATAVAEDCAPLP